MGEVGEERGRRGVILRGAYMLLLSGGGWSVRGQCAGGCGPGGYI